MKANINTNTNNSNSSVASSNKTNASRHSHFGATDGRRIYSCLSSIQRKVKHFKKKHLGPKSKNIDQSACVQCLDEEVLPQWKLAADDVRTYEAFLRLTLRKPLEELTASSESFIDLLGLSEKAQDFETLIVNECKLKLSILMEMHVVKTCISFKEESDDNNLKCVSEYEVAVQRYKSDLDTKYADLDKNLAYYDQISRPFLEYVKHGEEISAILGEVCNDLLAICKLVEAWVADDERYPGKLEAEMASTSSKMEDLHKRLHQIQQREESNQTEIGRLQRVEEKSEREYYTRRREKRKLKSRLADLEERKVYLDTKIAKYRQEKKNLQQDITAGSPLTAREQYDSQIKMAALDRLLGRLGEQNRLTEQQLKRVNKDMKPAIDTAYEHKVESVTLRHNKENLQKENRTLHKKKKALQHQLHELEHFNKRLKKIRELKMSGEAFRKNLRQQHRKEIAVHNGSHDLTEACKAAAPSIGKDWKKVYLCLPFDPPRDLDKLQRDVDILDHIAARNDVTDDVQALKSLEKWRAFNRKTDVMELVQALRQVKKRRLARDLENRFVGVPV